MTYDFLHLKISPPVAEVLLNRTEALNALNRKYLKELTAALQELEQKEEVRFLLLSSAHTKAFCAGADIREMCESSPQELNDFIEMGQKLMLMLERSRLMVIALVQGVCLGGGCELALACDFIIASPGASFGLPEVTLGLHPGFGGTQRLPRAIGGQRALHYILTGRRFSAEEAYQWGMVWELAPPEELKSRAQNLIEVLSSLGPQACARAKRLVRQAFALPLAEGSVVETRHFLEQVASPEGHEGLKAFVEKRKPSFSS